MTKAIKIILAIIRIILAIITGGKNGKCNGNKKDEL